MSNIETPTDSDTVRNMRDHIEKLEREAAERTEADQHTEAIARENALLKAGVDLKGPLGQMFAKAYDGELTEEAIVAAATEVGAITTTTPPEPPDPITDAERQAALERQGLGAEGQPPGTVQGDPTEKAYADFHRDLAKGKTRDQASAAVIGEFIAEANAGNPDFRYQPEEWKARQEAAANS